MHSFLVSIALVGSSWAVAQISDSVKIAAAIASVASPLEANQISDSITIDAGTLQGGFCPDSSSSFFLSIPYAQPPTGDLRFASPQPYTGNYALGTLNATTPAPACIQFGGAFIETPCPSDSYSRNPFRFRQHPGYSVRTNKYGL